MIVDMESKTFLIDIVHEAVETQSNPWAILSTWELWNHYNGAPTMTLCEGPQGRVLCELLTDPTSDEMLHRWLYVDVSDAEIPNNFDDWLAVYNWLENYMLTAFPETVTALADGFVLVALEIREFAERLGDYRLRAITSEECANKEETHHE